MTTAPQTPGSTATRPAPGRALNIALWTLQVGAAAMYGYSGVLKLTGDPMSVAGMDAIGFGGWFHFFIGAVEVAAAVGLLVPVLNGIAAIGSTMLMTGAVIVTIVVFHGAALANPAVMLAIVGFIAWGRWHRTVALADLLRRR